MDTTPQTAQSWINVFTENGFMVLLAIQGFVIPPLLMVGAFLLIRLSICKLANPLRRIADYLDDKEKEHGVQ